MEAKLNKTTIIELTISEHEALTLTSICEAIGGSMYQGSPRHVLSSLAACLRISGVVDGKSMKIKWSMPPDKCYPYVEADEG